MPGGPRTGIQFVWTPEPTIVANMYFEMAQRAAEMEVPMEEATIIMATEIDLNFALEGRPTPWPPLSLRTLMQRMRIQMNTVGIVGSSRTQLREASTDYKIAVGNLLLSGIKILQRTGKLKSGAVDPRSWVIDTWAMKTTATLADATGYGHFHITGAPANNMPMRDYTYISDEGMTEIENMFGDWIAEPWENAAW